MKFYPERPYDCTEELMRYYPRFYRDVLEMREIIKASGKLADGLEDAVERTYLNCFIDLADEATITEMEMFLYIIPNRSRPLEERKRLVKAYFVGFGSVSATMLSEIIRSYTGGDSDIYFIPADAEGNNTLFIDYERGAAATIYVKDVHDIIAKKIPAHLNWIATLAYNMSVVTSSRADYYTTEYSFCGTLYAGDDF